MAIACALLGDVRVLIVENPTLGQDSVQAARTISVLRRYADQGVTVCATVKNPPPASFALFQQALVLLGGRVVYHGPTGDALLTHFRALGATLPASTFGSASAKAMQPRSEGGAVPALYEGERARGAASPYALVPAPSTTTSADASYDAPAEANGQCDLVLRLLAAADRRQLSEAWAEAYERSDARLYMLGSMSQARDVCSSAL